MTRLLRQNTSHTSILTLGQRIKSVTDVHIGYRLPSLIVRPQNVAILHATEAHLHVVEVVEKVVKRHPEGPILLFRVSEGVSNIWIPADMEKKDAFKLDGLTRASLHRKPHSHRTEKLLLIPAWMGK